MGPGFESLKVHQGPFTDLFSFHITLYGVSYTFLHLLVLVLSVVLSSDCSQLTLNLLFVGRTRRITQYTEDYPILTVLPFFFRYAVGPGSKSKRILRGSGAERTSGGCSRPRKTERAVRARLESLKVHQGPFTDLFSFHITPCAFDYMLHFRQIARN